MDPRRVRFVESEYAIPRASLGPVITELRRWIDRHDERIGIPIYDTVAMAVWDALRLGGIDTAPGQAWGSVFAR